MASHRLPKARTFHLGQEFDWPSRADCTCHLIGKCPKHDAFYYSTDRAKHRAPNKHREDSP